MSDIMESYQYFPSAVHMIEKPEFLEAARRVSMKYLEMVDYSVNEIYPVKMSPSLLDDSDIHPLSNYVAQTAWNVLSGQGYDMDNYRTVYKELWCQEHHKHSGMEQHVHGYGAQIVGFYFIDCPENCSRVVFHDPRPGKLMNMLPEINTGSITEATSMINFIPKPGMLMFSNAWLAHSFTRHGSEEPMRFIHFNLTTQYIEQNNSSAIII